MPVTADGVAGPAQILSNQSGIAYNLSCVPGRACTVVGQSNVPTAALAVDVVRGAPTAVTMWPNINTFWGVSCIAPASCAIVGNRANDASPVDRRGWRRS